MRVFVIVGAVSSAMIFAVLLTRSVRSPEGADTPEVHAERFLKSLDMKGKVSCATNDTDGDGYVSCTFKPDDGGDLKALDCAAWFSFNEGCRLTRLRVDSF